MAPRALRALALLVLAAKGLTGTPPAPLAFNPLLEAARQGSPEQPQIFRAGADLVRLDVSVLGRDGAPVRGLTASDFTVLEGGKPMPIEAFAEVVLPAWPADRAPWVREVEPDLVSNRADASRAVIILMDDAATMMDPGDAVRARAIASEVIDGLGPADIAAVVYTAARRNGQEFSRDRARLHAAVARFVPAGPTPPPRAMEASAPTRGLTLPSQASVPSGRCPGGRCLTDALNNAAAILGEWPGTRKLVVMIGSGRLNVSGVSELDSLPDDLQRTIQALQKANMTVYEFDPRGLEVGRAPTDFSVFADNVTGGRAFKDSNSPEAHVREVFRENSSYYLLGLRSSDARRDGRFRPVKVQVDRPGLDVRARSGYYAPSDRAAKAKAQQSDPLDMALSRGLPAGDLPLRMTVAPFATADKPGGAIVLVVGVDRENVSGEMMVELAAAAFDDRWRQAAGQTQRLMLPHAEGQRVSDATVLLDVKPGRYEVRAAVKAPDGRTGSAFTSITVPEFARAPLSMSGLAIADGSPSVFPTGAAALGLPRLTTDRAFSSDRRVSLVSRIYQGGGKSGVSVTVRARIVNDRGAEQFTAESALAATTFADGRQADYRFALPLDRLSVGDYLVTIEATAGLLTERRQLRFAVSR